MKRREGVRRRRSGDGGEHGRGEGEIERPDWVPFSTCAARPDPPVLRGHGLLFHQDVRARLTRSSPSALWEQSVRRHACTAVRIGFSRAIKVAISGIQLQSPAPRCASASQRGHGRQPRRCARSSRATRRAGLSPCKADRARRAGPARWRTGWLRGSHAPVGK